MTNPTLRRTANAAAALLTQNGFATRFSKHFSGYNVVVDRSGDDSGFGGY